MATLGGVIQQCDDIKPNAFSNATKTGWLNEAEGLVQTEVMLLAIEEVIVYDYTDNEQTVMLAEPPHDKLYWAYLCAMIDFANGEYNKYQNTMQLFNAYFGEYMRWFAARYRPADGEAEERGYYISAYGIAVKHGYEGTEEQWLLTLKGEQGAAGASVDMQYDTGEGKLQWKRENDTTWNDLIDIETIRGDVVEQTLAAAQAAASSAVAAQSGAEAAESGAEAAATQAASSAAAAAAAQSGAETAQGAAETAQSGAETAESGAQTAATQAASSAAAAAAAQSGAEAAQGAAETAQSGAAASATQAATSATAAASSAAAAAAAQSGAEAAQGAAETAQSGAAASASGAATSATSAESWAVGGTGTRSGEDTNNSKYWCEQAQSAAGGGVTSFNSRTGVVLPQNGDYTAAMVGADASGTAATAVATHNSSSTAHSDIRQELEGKETSGAAAAVQQNLNTHAGNTGIHVTTSEKTVWNAKSGKALSFDVTLTVSGWINKAQTVSNAKILLGEYAYIVIPEGGSFTEYTEAAIYADNVSTAGQMTFHCSSVPSTALTVNILRAEAEE